MEEKSTYKWAVLRNGEQRAVFHTRDSAMAHRNSMESISISLKKFKDNWQVIFIGEDEKEMTKKERIEARKRAALSAEIAKSRAQLEKRRSKYRKG